MKVFEEGRGRNNDKNWLGKGIFELFFLKKGGLIGHPHVREG
jgi:hypothetical protein